MIPWTVNVKTSDAKSSTIRTLSMHATKREAVTAMMAVAEPKKPIQRIGRDYIIETK